MKRLLLFLINPCAPLLIYVISCNTNAQTRPNQTNKDSISVNRPNELPSYDSTKAAATMLQKELQRYYKKDKYLNYNYAGERLAHFFEHNLLPHWLGTPWDFNGTTKIPGQGHIACGYFVTTTLSHLGINIPIAKYAQCGSEVMMKYLVQKRNYHNYSQFSFTDFISKLKARPPFLAIIGLDFHTGYVLHTKNELYFMHSSYVQRQGVIKQIAGESGELKSSKWRSIAFLTEDSVFLKKWVHQQ